MLESFLNFLFNFFSRFRTQAPVAQQALSSQEEKHIEKIVTETKKDEKQSERRDVLKVKQNKQKYTSLCEQGDLLKNETDNGRIMPLNFSPISRRPTDRKGVNYPAIEGGFITSGTSSTGEFITPMSKKTESPAGRKRTARAETTYLGNESEDSCCDIVSAFKSCWASLFGSNESPRSIQQAQRKKSSAVKDEKFIYLPRRNSGSH